MAAARAAAATSSALAADAGRLREELSRITSENEALQDSMQQAAAATATAANDAAAAAAAAAAADTAVRRCKFNR